MSHFTQHTYPKDSNGRRYERVFTSRTCNITYKLYYNTCDKSNGARDFDITELIKALKDKYDIPLITQADIGEGYFYLFFHPELKWEEEKLTDLRELLDDIFCTANWWRVDVTLTPDSEIMIMGFKYKHTTI